MPRVLRFKKRERKDGGYLKNKIKGERERDN